MPEMEGDDAMFCPNCGEQVAETANFCRKCGKNLKEYLQQYADTACASIENDNIVEINNNSASDNSEEIHELDIYTCCFLKFYLPIFPVIYTSKNISRIFISEDDNIEVYKKLHEFINTDLYIISRNIINNQYEGIIERTACINIELHESLRIARNILSSFKEVEDSIALNKDSEDSIWNSDISAGSGIKKKLFTYSSIGLTALINPASALGLAIFTKRKTNKNNDAKIECILSYKDKEFDSLNELLQYKFDNMLVRVFNKREEIFSEININYEDEKLTIDEKNTLKAVLPYLPDMLTNSLKEHID